MQDRQLTIPDEIDKSIARITTIGEAKEYRANGQTLLRYVQEHGLGIGTANQVMKAILLTEHKLGTMLNELAPHGGDGRTLPNEYAIKEAQKVLIEALKEQGQQELF
jgi:hypothetical protein